MVTEATTTTPTTTATPTTPIATLTPLTDDAPCPADDTIFRPAQTTDGSNFQFRVFMDSYRSFASAEAFCASHGAKLYKILTTQRMAFTLSLMSCTAYTGRGFWVNGEYYGINDYQTTDGEQLQMSNTFWYSGRPNYPGSENCVWLNSGFGHKFDDTDCANSVVYTICEIE